MTEPRARSVSETIKNWTQTVAITAAGLWAIYTFVYQNQIVPASRPPHLTLSSDVTKIEKRDQFTAIQYKLTTTNHSAVRVRVLRAVFDVAALSTKAQEEIKEPGSFSRSAVADLREHERTSTIHRFMRPNVRERVAVGRFMHLDTILEPNQTHSREVLAFIPPGYDAVEFNAYLHFAKKVDRVVAVPIPSTAGRIQLWLFRKEAGYDPHKPYDEIKQFLTPFCPDVDRSKLYKEIFCPEVNPEHRAIRKEDGVGVVRHDTTSSLW